MILKGGALDQTTRVKGIKTGTRWCKGELDQCWKLSSAMCQIPGMYKYNSNHKFIIHDID